MSQRHPRKKNPAFGVKRDQRKGLRAVVAEGVAFGSMGAAAWRLRKENMGSGGHSSMFVSGTTYTGAIRNATYNRVCDII